MSEKEASITLDAYDEDTDAAVTVTAAVDFINPGCVYLAVSRWSVGSIAIPTAEALRLATFIENEARPPRSGRTSR